METSPPPADVPPFGPGFRFHPTDDELVSYYLKRKAHGRRLHFDPISVIDIYKAEPWDLPAKSRLKTRDLEWYFFSILDKKYGNSSRTNRATDRGYWKTTGKDRAVYHKTQTTGKDGAVYHKTQIVGMKKTLVYHCGRAPRGERTNWVMHEYMLLDQELKDMKEPLVLCRVFQKSGSGPRNGEQYGAPFVEEEWDDNLLEQVPIREATNEDFASNDDYLDGIDVEEILRSIPSECGSFPNSDNGGNSNHVEASLNGISDDQKLGVGMAEIYYAPEQLYEQRLLNLPMENDVDNTNSVDVENLFSDGAYLETNDLRTPIELDIGESIPANNHGCEDFLLDEPYVDATDNPQFGDSAFLETNDLESHIKEDASGLKMLEEYVTFFDADDQNLDGLAFDSSELVGNQNNIDEEVSFSLKDLNGGHDPLPISNLNALGQEIAVTSFSKNEPKQQEHDFQSSFIKQASRMLGDIPAPPAFAAEFPEKDAARHLNYYLSQSSGSDHRTTGMIQLQNMSIGGKGMELSFVKHGDINITLSIGLLEGNDYASSLESVGSNILSSTKSISLTTRSCFYFIFLCVLVLCFSIKMRSCIYAR